MESRWSNDCRQPCNRVARHFARLMSDYTAGGSEYASGIGRLVVYRKWVAVAPASRRAFARPTRGVRTPKIQLRAITAWDMSGRRQRPVAIE